MQPTNSPHNRRSSPRLPVTLSIDYCIAGRAYRDFTRDLSLSSVFVLSRRSYPAGTPVVSVLELPDPLKITGHVTRSNGHGFAVKFNANKHLTKFVINNLNVLDSCRELSKK